jgi:nucleotide-binding universal stress UspA family protein
MLLWKKIICPVDFSDGSLEALTYATELALHFSSELYLVHVLPTDLETAEWKGEADAAVERLIYSEAAEKLQKLSEPLGQKGLRTHSVIVPGDPAEQIVSFAKEEDADLIVIATHGATGWRHLAFGSVTEKVVRLATCLVLTIRMKAVLPAADKAA